MNQLWSVLAAALALIAGPAAAQEPARWSFAIHGGAGVIERDSLTPEQDAAYRAALHRALEAGSSVLADGGSALDAIQAAIQIMEDDPLFNAGRGGRVNPPPRPPPTKGHKESAPPPPPP
ncbi:MAG: isoaspartyl peptidase/L-asparaginase, partial [Brevundimonas sp.]|nr:isoaspartyl peptidase/L-asparaginase [Brevundimonas sp.]